MHSVPMIAGSRAPFYRGRQLCEGETFFATPTDADYFERTGRAAVSAAKNRQMALPASTSTAKSWEDAPEVVIEMVGITPDELVIADEPQQEAQEAQPADDLPRVKRAYRRRDMRPESAV